MNIDTMIDTIYLAKDTTSANALNYTDSINSIVSLSKSLSTLSATIFGASILFLISTSYKKPDTRSGRYFFLILLPVWISLVTSLYYSVLLERHDAAKNQTTKEAFRGIILGTVRESYHSQFNWFFVGLCFLGIGLSIYLFWWIYSAPQSVKTEPYEKEMD